MSTLIGLDGNVSSNTANYDNPAFCNAIKQINPGVYRTPGSASDDYHWRNDKPSLDSVKLMYDVVKPKMIFVVNMLTKGKRNNLAMLDYAADIGLPVDDSLIEFGNEYNIFGCLAREKYPTVDDYAKTCADWAKDIRLNFPQAKFLCVGENKNYKDTIHWNSSVLEHMPDASLVWHYHNPSQYVFGGVPDAAIIRANVDENFEEVFSGIPVSKVCMTEFSLEEQLHEERREVDFITPEAHKMAVTLMLQKFVDFGLPIVCYHNVVGSNKSAIVSNRFATWLQPTGEAIKDFNNA